MMNALQMRTSRVDSRIRMSALKHMSLCCAGASRKNPAWENEKHRVPFHVYYSTHPHLSVFLVFIPGCAIDRELDLVSFHIICKAFALGSNARHQGHISKVHLKPGLWVVPGLSIPSTVRTTVKTRLERRVLFVVRAGGEWAVRDLAAC